MVNVTFTLQWSYSKYVLLAFAIFMCTSFFSSASVLESLIIGIISGMSSFWLDALFKLPDKIIKKVENTKNILNAKVNKNVTTANEKRTDKQNNDNDHEKSLKKSQAVRNIKDEFASTVEFKS